MTFKVKIMSFKSCIVQVLHFCLLLLWCLSVCIRCLSFKDHTILASIVACQVAARRTSKSRTMSDKKTKQQFFERDEPHQPGGRCDAETSDAASGPLEKHRRTGFDPAWLTEKKYSSGCTGLTLAAC